MNKELNDDGAKSYISISTATRLATARASLAPLTRRQTIFAPAMTTDHAMPHAITSAKLSK